MSLVRSITVAALLTVLQGCGGGGESSSPADTPEQPLQVSSAESTSSVEGAAKTVLFVAGQGTSAAVRQRRNRAARSFAVTSQNATVTSGNISASASGTSSAFATGPNSVVIATGSSSVNLNAIETIESPVAIQSAEIENHDNSGSEVVIIDCEVSGEAEVGASIRANLSGDEFEFEVAAEAELRNCDGQNGRIAFSSSGRLSRGVVEFSSAVGASVAGVCLVEIDGISAELKISTDPFRASGSFTGQLSAECDVENIECRWSNGRAFDSDESLGCTVS